jgi:hypothetical protein
MPALHETVEIEGSDAEWHIDICSHVSQKRLAHVRRPTTHQNTSEPKSRSGCSVKYMIRVRMATILNSKTGLG